MSPTRCVVWYQRDLRVHDHAPLAAAAEIPAAVLPLFVLDDEALGSPGAASRWWLHHALAALDGELRHRGSRLVLRRGAAAEAIEGVFAATGAEAVYFEEATEPAARRLQEAVSRRLAGRAEVRCFPANLLHAPAAIRSGGGHPFRVFTPFWRACLREAEPPPPLAVPGRIAAPTQWPHSERLGEWGLLPAGPDWAGGLRETWTPGTATARRRLEEFCGDGLAGYPVNRDRPDAQGTSRLSPHLHFGEVSVREVWHGVRRAAGRQPGAVPGADAFLREVGWREFAAHLLAAWPSLPDQPFRAEFAAFPWQDDAGALRAWQRGETGYPIVDAGMRELWATGWMHNRVRMIAASFLVKHLLVHWQLGAAWFADTLVDADLASNTVNWQWVAGCGTDAAPYFRIFNPVLQGRKFDPHGAYVRRWVPELAALPDDSIHAPWEAPEVARAAGVRLGHGYPQPIVDHARARAAALAAFRTLRVPAGRDGG